MVGLKSNFLYTNTQSLIFSTARLVTEFLLTFAVVTCLPIFQQSLTGHSCVYGMQLIFSQITKTVFLVFIHKHFVFVNTIVQQGMYGVNTKKNAQFMTFIGKKKGSRPLLIRMRQILNSHAYMHIALVL